MTHILSVSISDEQKAFLNEVGHSASALLQRSINESMENYKVNSQTIKDLQNRISALQELIRKQGNFIERKGLNDEWLKELGA